ncbi:MAG: DUF3108 domain-containing protein [Bacteroidaceae bacterium]|nr:DUF3108 domain-containing protein [Bacteroidaceae bacterium]
MRKLLSLILFFVMVPATFAQCPVKNTAFNSGEHLEYDLYFNWKFIWIKVGSAEMDISRTTYNGTDAYEAYLITRGSKSADRYFVMRDTLTAFVTPDLVPLAYVKAAFEGKSYRKNEVLYRYTPQGTELQMYYRKNENPAQTQTILTQECPYDMISMLLKARSMDGSQFKKGDCIDFVMADGRDCKPQKIIFRGRKKFTNEHTDEKYRCLVFSFVEMEDNTEKEIVTFYITDDANHLPVRLDLNLRFGSAKAFLINAKGVRNPQTSLLK